MLMGQATGRVAARAALLRRQAVAAEERKRREVANVSDLTTFVVEAAKLDEVDGWERTRLEGVREEAERRRVGHRVRAGKALQALRFRGESLAAIAEQAGVSAAVIRSYLRAAAADAPLSGSDGESGVRPATGAASATDGDATAVGRAESPPAEATG
jgi:hypothetical protein